MCVNVSSARRPPGVVGVVGQRVDAAQHLALDEPAEASVGHRHQSGVGAGLRDAAVVQQRDAVGVTDGGEAVRDGDDGAAERDALQRLLHQVLAVGVERAAAHTNHALKPNYSENGICSFVILSN